MRGLSYTELLSHQRGKVGFPGPLLKRGKVAGKARRIATLHNSYFLGATAQSSVQLSPLIPESAAHVRGLRKFMNTFNCLVRPCILNFITRAAVQDRPRSRSFRLSVTHFPPTFNTAAPARGLSGARPTSTKPCPAFSPSFVFRGGLQDHLKHLSVEVKERKLMTCC